MKRFGPELLAQQVAEEMASSVLTIFDGASAKSGWTPIENLFFVALYLKQKTIEAETMRMGLLKASSHTKAQEVLKSRTDVEFGVFPQCQVGGWRVDFLIGVLSAGGMSWLVVECDGHDFHERTKEQAAKDRSRDRECQSKGLTVFRFTGSELFRNPLGCATQVYDWLVKEYWRLEDGA